MSFFQYSATVHTDTCDPCLSDESLEYPLLSLLTLGLQTPDENHPFALNYNKLP